MNKTNSYGKKQNYPIHGRKRFENIYETSRFRVLKRKADELREERERKKKEKAEKKRRKRTTRKGNFFGVVGQLKVTLSVSFATERSQETKKLDLKMFVL